MAITDIKEAYRRADETGEPQEVLGDDGKRVMLIVCPKDRRAAPCEECGMCNDRVTALLAEVRSLREGLACIAKDFPDTYYAAQAVLASLGKTPEAT